MLQLMCDQDLRRNIPLLSWRQPHAQSNCLQMQALQAGCGVSSSKRELRRCMLTAGSACMRTAHLPLL